MRITEKSHYLLSYKKLEYALLLTMAFLAFSSAAPLIHAQSPPIVTQDFQTALDSAKRGSTIRLQAGTTFSGKFNLPNIPCLEPNGTCTDADYITITTSGALPAPDGKGLFPASDGLMVTPQSAAIANLPKLVAPGGNAPLIKTDPGAHNYRFVGIEFMKINGDSLDDLILLGDGQQAGPQII